MVIVEASPLITAAYIVSVGNICFWPLELSTYAFTPGKKRHTAENPRESVGLQVLVFSSNPLYDGDRAREAETDNDPTTVYLVDRLGEPKGKGKGAVTSGPLVIGGTTEFHL